jgi:hypothetical protein
MKRDMDLLREILLVIEESSSLEGCQVKIPGRSTEEVYYNAQQAHDAGLIDTRFAHGSPDFHVIRLTYQGHEFLDAARSDTRWTKAKEIVIKNTGTLSLEALKLTLETLIRHTLGG